MEKDKPEKINQMPKTISRKDFVKLAGIGAASVLFFGCMAACTKPTPPPTPSNTNNNNSSNNNNPSSCPTQNVVFTLDLTDSQNQALQNNGGYIYKNDIIVAKTINGDYIAVSAKCTHQGFYVQYNSSNDEFHCPNHGSNFNSNGTVVNGPANAPLTQYNTCLDGNNLTVFS